MNVKQIRNNDPLYQEYISEINNLIQSRKEEKEQNKKQQQQKTLKPFEQSLRDYPELSNSRIPILSPKPGKTTPPKPSEEEE
jgi:hypothetical protein